MTMPNLASLFSLAGYIDIAIGFVVRMAYCRIKMKVLDRLHPEDAPHRQSMKLIVLAWAIAILGIGATSMQTQATHNATLALAESTAVCENQLRTALQSQKELQTENDALAAQERRATADWLALVVTPPQSIFDLHTTDPVYQEWARGVNRDYQMKLQSIGAQREAVVKQREEHKIPEPTCGK